VIETAFSRKAQAAGIDLPKLQAEWQARRPAGLRELALPEGEVRRLMAAAIGVLSDPTLAALGEVETSARAIARRVAGAAPVELLLRYFRDDLVRLLIREIPHELRAPTALGQLVSRLSDAF
jgi:hypothetical protein